MTSERLNFAEPVTLAGGGVLDTQMLEDAMSIAPTLIAADGAADRLIHLGHTPAAVIGDMDSIREREALPRTVTQIELAEQDTTDFEKCLYSVTAPLFLAVGFTGGRQDHTLAVFHAMMRHPGKPVILIGEEEVIALAPPARTLELALDPGARVSFVPLAPVTGMESSGLEWPIDGLEMEIGTRIGTSNRASARVTRFGFDRPGSLVLLERRALGALIAALGS